MSQSSLQCICVKWIHNTAQSGGMLYAGSLPPLRFLSAPVVKTADLALLMMHLPHGRTPHQTQVYPHPCPCQLIAPPGMCIKHSKTASAIKVSHALCCKLQAMHQAMHSATDASRVSMLQRIGCEYALRHRMDRSWVSIGQRRLLFHAAVAR